MAERQLSFVPDEGQPPNPFLDPRTWGVVLGMISGAVPWLTTERVGQLSALITGVLAFVLYVWGARKSGQRQQVVDSTLKAVSSVQYGDTATVPLPNGTTTDVRVVPGNETPTKGQ